MRPRFRVFALAAIAAFMGPVLMAQTRQELQTKFDQEPDVMRRAHILMELSRADFHDVADEVAAGDNTDALTTLQQLLDDMQHCSAALDAKEPNPEGHPGGFKQLEIAARESLRRLDDLTVGLPGDEQTPFLAIRKNLDQLNRHLIRQLFPRQPQPPEPADPEQPRTGARP
jgi:hypothetical protein